MRVKFVYVCCAIFFTFSINVYGDYNFGNRKKLLGEVIQLVQFERVWRDGTSIQEAINLIQAHGGVQGAGSVQAQQLENHLSQFLMLVRKGLENPYLFDEFLSDTREWMKRAHLGDMRGEGLVRWTRSSEECHPLLVQNSTR